MNFWEKLKKPIFVLAPMADVTDAAFRRIIAKYSRPHGPAVFWTEFVSADGLARADERGREKLLRDLQFSEGERPIVAQFFTAVPEMMERAAALALSLGFDGVDINMGCPDKSVEKQGAGAALMKNPSLAREIIAAAKQGAGPLPISVKTRLGYGKNEIEAWLPALLEAKPAAVTIHARTRKEMSAVPARWEQVKRAVEIRNQSLVKTLIIGNGDAVTLPDAKRKIEETGSDGVMLGRAIFGNPWLFHEEEKVSFGEKLAVAVEHARLFEELLGDFSGRSSKNFAVMKKHLKAYVRDFAGARELRTELMESNDAEDVAAIIGRFLASTAKSVASFAKER